MTSNQEDLRDLILYFDDGDGIPPQTAMYIGELVKERFGIRGLSLLSAYTKVIGHKITLDGRNKEVWEKLELLGAI